MATLKSEIPAAISTPPDAKARERAASVSPERERVLHELERLIGEMSVALHREFGKGNDRVQAFLLFQQTKNWLAKLGQVKSDDPRTEKLRADLETSAQNLQDDLKVFLLTTGKKPETLSVEGKKIRAVQNQFGEYLEQQSAEIEDASYVPVEDDELMSDDAEPPSGARKKVESTPAAQESVTREPDASPPATVEKTAQPEQLKGNPDEILRALHTKAKAMVDTIREMAQKSKDAAPQKNAKKPDKVEWLMDRILLLKEIAGKYANAADIDLDEFPAYGSAHEKTRRGLHALHEEVRAYESAARDAYQAMLDDSRSKLLVKDIKNISDTLKGRMEGLIKKMGELPTKEMDEEFHVVREERRKQREAEEVQAKKAADDAAAQAALDALKNAGEATKPPEKETKTPPPTARITVVSGVVKEQPPANDATTPTMPDTATAEPKLPASPDAPKVPDTVVMSASPDTTSPSPDTPVAPAMVPPPIEQIPPMSREVGYEEVLNLLHAKEIVLSSLKNIEPKSRTDREKLEIRALQSQADYLKRRKDYLAHRKDADESDARDVPRLERAKHALEMRQQEFDKAKTPAEKERLLALLRQRERDVDELNGKIDQRKKQGTALLESIALLYLMAESTGNDLKKMDEETERRAKEAEVERQRMEAQQRAEDARRNTIELQRQADAEKKQEKKTPFFSWEVKRSRVLAATGMAIAAPFGLVMGVGGGLYGMVRKPGQSFFYGFSRAMSWFDKHVLRRLSPTRSSWVEKWIQPKEHQVFEPTAKNKES